jgi:hypothetical protein
VTVNGSYADKNIFNGIFLTKINLWNFFSSNTLVKAFPFCNHHHFIHRVSIQTLLALHHPKVGAMLVLHSPFGNDWFVQPLLKEPYQLSPFYLGPSIGVATPQLRVCCTALKLLKHTLTHSTDDLIY